jgi:single-stranded-DNA-specific exonuclease
MATNADYDAFHNRAKQLADVIKEHIQNDSFIVAVSHHDADGLSAAATVGAVLSRAKARFTLRIVEELRDEILAEISATKPDLAILTDIGSGYLDLLRTHLEAKVGLVLDHHPPTGHAPSKILQLNPHEFGIDGARMVSAAGVSYFVARQLSDRNVDLSALAVVGALGDMQDRNENRSLMGLNEQLVQDGVSSGNLKVDSDLVLYGHETRPIHRALAYTTTPYLPDLSGREDNCLALLSSAGIRIKDGDRFRTLADLSQEEKQKLVNAIIAHLSSMGFQSSVVLDMVGTVYTLVNEPPGSPTRDAREYAALLNACGRTGNPSIGVSVGLGDRRTALDEANEVVSNYRKTLASYMDWLTKTPDAVQKFKSIWVIRGENTIQDSMTGAFSSIISSAGSLSPDHVIIVLTRAKDSGIKLSARAPLKLLKLGVNLGAALNATTKKYSGFGGGHNVAAGAHIKVQDPTPFLQELDKFILGQMQGIVGN